MDNQKQLNSIKRISVANNGTQANGQSGSSSISDDGRFIPFESNATNLFPSDTNGHTDTFIYNRLNQTVELISLAPNGIQANGSSSTGSISGDGNYVVFASFASNLVTNDTNNQRDIFVYDRVKQITELVSINDNGVQANGLNLFSTIDRSGRLVAFESTASNLVAGDTNGTSDIFVRDRISKNTSRINLASDGTQANGASTLGSISDDSRYVSFTSNATNLVPNDINGKSDVFVYDRVNQTVELVSGANGVANGGASGFISGNGNFVVYESDANNLVPGDTNGKKDIFVYDRVKKTTELIDLAADGTQSNGNSRDASISDDGRYIAFLSDASNLVSGDTNGASNVFVRDRQEKTTKLLDANSFPTLSGDGQSLVFNSSLSTFVSNDTNNVGDVFVVDLTTPTTQPPTTEPPTTQPPTTEPPTTQPPTTEPPTTEPPTTEPPTTEPPITQPPTTEPPITQPPTTEPPTTQPPTTEPPITQPPIGMSNFSINTVDRFYQFEKGFHLYTSDPKEIDFVKQQSAAGELAYRYEAEKFNVLSNDKDALTGKTLEGVEPVYRFFNTATGSHLYTADEREKSFIEDNLSNYNSEGIKYYAFESAPVGIETIPVFRMLNTTSGSHLYTIDQKEFNFIQENLPNFVVENNGEAVYHVFEL